ncbi:hypothetical protein A3F55_01045 [Candidatus Adlerbacteria bacterium RIFCSPHIGHO2_12_FULL_53_18]|uniref:Uncharacterized protein n=1 Tax=Candidatus Adlerbacteria bacterium RIFCSPHIGHO2_12_FULL_53_18 TaxID=1797242 RepID=A0A1F4XSA0_9BACT|nr:MAG: hypothetical protein A3F55_01045 [Candidatus Adlerbacteria bacterium RIFCSPHIGHO2_12_FULL_53_18]
MSEYMTLFVLFVLFVIGVVLMTWGFRINFENEKFVGDAGSDSNDVFAGFPTSAVGFILVMGSLLYFMFGDI